MRNDYISFFEAARLAGRELNLLSGDKINAVLLAVADALERETETILAANAADLMLMPQDDPQYDRLLLTPERIRGMAGDMRNVACLPSPLGHTLSHTVRPNGMRIDKVSVPFGVIGVIYEARPNVSCDVFALCFKTGNASLLKGSQSAANSNRAIVKLIRDVLSAQKVNPDSVILLPSDRAATDAMLHAVGYVDLVIPRGSASLIEHVRNNARVPVIETGAGICHTYFDCSGNAEKGAGIVFNAKTRRVSVCNALDCLLVHHERLDDLPVLCSQLAEKNVTIYADPDSFAALEGHYPSGWLAQATPESYGTEFLDYKMAVKCVGSLDETLQHIARHSSGHSEAIITEDASAAETFTRSVDAACVYVNVSTAFTDGAQFGLGAEIGISTQKLHARGPMGLAELTTYKYIIRGEGQIRE